MKLNCMRISSDFRINAQPQVFFETFEMAGNLNAMEEKSFVRNRHFFVPDSAYECELEISFLCIQTCYDIMYI